MDLEEIGCEDMDRIYLAQVRVWWWGSCEHGNEPLGYMKGSEFFDQQSGYQLCRKDLAACNWLGVYACIEAIPTGHLV
jgi:hypothetical protein